MPVNNRICVYTILSTSSTLQSTVAMSTTEVEYRATTEAMEVIWLQRLLDDMGID